MLCFPGLKPGLFGHIEYQCFTSCLYFLVKEEVNFGSRLLYPHISSILERFKIRLASSTKKGSGLNKKELLVLSYVSEFVRAPDTSATLTELLLPILTKRIGAPHEDEEVVLKMMNTLNHLVKNVKEPHCYIRYDNIVMPILCPSTFVKRF